MFDTHTHILLREVCLHYNKIQSCQAQWATHEGAQIQVQFSSTSESDTDNSHSIRTESGSIKIQASVAISASVDQFAAHNEQGFFGGRMCNACCHGIVVWSLSILNGVVL